jgi:REP element-mobilizing transposase RayT
MPRPVRIDFPGARHHVMNRGHRRGPVFIDDWCCSAFTDVLGQAVDRYGILLHGYSLMPNHYHLMVESVHGNLSPAMAFISATFARNINDRFHWEGSVFRGRYNNRLVTEPEHWQYLLAYIHLNPVKARLVLSLEQTRWTSHDVYVGDLKCPDWLHTAALLKALGGRRGYKSLMKAVQVGRRPEPADFGQVLFGRCRSSEAFIVKQEEQARAITPEMALEQVLDITGGCQEILYQTKRGKTGNPVRGVAAWWLTHGAGLTNVKAGQLLNMTPVAVSKALARLQTQLVRDPAGETAQWVLKLRDLL